MQTRARMGPEANERQHAPFALSLSKCRGRGFDGLSPNGAGVLDATKRKIPPFALSLSKCRGRGFDKLSPNGS